MTPAPALAALPPGRLRIGSLCSGYGGLDMAVTVILDAEVAWCAETDPHAAAVLAARWPGLRNFGDITALGWAQVPSVDLITAGWLCQDISYAGLGSGITKGSRSGLWHYIADGLRQLRPAYVVLENVAALRSRGLAKVPGDLAEIGYDTQWTCLRASDTGACHRRDRAFILAVRPGAAARLAAADCPGSGCSHKGESVAPWLARRNRPGPGRSREKAGARPGNAIRLLPTPDTGLSPDGHGRRGGRAGNGHQSGNSLDATARTLVGGPGTGQLLAQVPVARGEYEPAIRRWETSLVIPLRRPPNPAQAAGPGCRPGSPSG